MGRIDQSHSTTPANPDANRSKLYPKGDNHWYSLDASGNERRLDGSGNRSKTIIIENPGSAEDISMFFTVAVTITKMRAILVGSSTPSVTWTVRHGTDRSAAGSEVVTGGSTTTETTTGSDITSFDDATVVANSHLWLETTAQSGIVDSIAITIFFSED